MTDPTDELTPAARADLEVWIKSFDLRRPFDPNEHPKITELRERYKNLRAILSQHEADKRERERLEAVLLRLERAISHQQALRTTNNGSASATSALQDARIALDDAILAARQALTPKESGDD